MEKANRAESQAANKKKKYATAEMKESIAFDDDVEMIERRASNGNGGM